MATVYGIDTGSWKLRIAAMEGSFNRYALRDVIELVPSLAEDGSVVHGDALRGFAAGEPAWESGERALAWPTELGVVRLVRLPFVDKNAIARALPAEVESQVPYDLDDMVLVTRVLDAREGQSRTMAFIVPREDLRLRIDELKAAGAEPRVVTFDVAALSTYADRGVQAIIDVGHRRTVIAVCQNGSLVAGRSIARGGASFTQAVVTHTGLDWTAAEAQKHATAIERRGDEAHAEWDGEHTDTQVGRVSAEAPIGAQTARALREAGDQWSVEVRAELIAVEDELGLGVDEVLVCGGGARLEGLGELLSAQLGVAARPVVVPGGYPIENALAVALGRVAAGEARAVDLRVDALAYHGTAEALWNIVGYTTVGSTIALVAGVVLGVVQLWDVSSRLDDLDAQVVTLVKETFPELPADKIEDPSMALALMKEEVAETSARVEALGSTITGVPPTLEMLKLLSERLPAPKEARIDVRELTLSAEAVSMKAETDSYESAAKIEEALKEDPLFAEAKKSDEKKSGEALTFTLSIPLGAPETAGEEG